MHRPRTIARMRNWFSHLHAWLTGRMEYVQAQRPTNNFVQTGFDLLERDSRSAGGVLGGGLAYRLFFWSLALSVLAFGGLGFAAPGDVEQAAKNTSLGGQVAKTLAEGAQASQANRWWLLGVGIVLTIWFAWSLLRALRLVQASAWQVRGGRSFPRPLNILTVLAVPVVFVLLSALTGVTTHFLGIFSGVVAFVLGTAVLAGLIMLGMAWLPSKPVPFWAHLPGAVVVALLVQGLGAFGEFFIADELASKQALYGALGLAGAMLFVLFLVGRTTVWACELNAVWWQVWHPDEASDAERITTS